MFELMVLFTFTTCSSPGLLEGIRSGPWEYVGMVCFLHQCNRGRKKMCAFPLRDNNILPSRAVILGKVQSCRQPTRHLENLHGCRTDCFPCFVRQFQRNSPKNTARIFFLYFAKQLSFLTVAFLCAPIAVCAALNSVPSNLPSDIVKMDLSRNNIQHLRPKQFLLSKDLKLLNLSSNNLRHIDTGEANAQNNWSPWQQ